MVGSVNKVILIGNVGNDPEIRSTQSKTEIANFSLATTETWKDKTTGERREKTEWHRIVVFSEGLVKIIKDYVKKGTKLYVEGALQTRKWVDNTGNERYTTEVILQGFNSTLTILSPLSSSGEGFKHNDDNFKSDKAPAFTEELDDEIPF